MYIVNLSVLAHVWRTAYAPLAYYVACVSSSAYGILSLFVGGVLILLFLHYLAAFIKIYWTTEKLSIVLTSKNRYAVIINVSCGLSMESW